MKNGNQKNNGIILTVFLAAFFGLAAGISGELVARVYLFENVLRLPVFGQIDLSSGQGSGANLIIREAKNVVVEQDRRVTELLSEIDASLVGIYKRKVSAAKAAGPADNDPLGLAAGYWPGEAVGQGLIVTSDGWIITGSFPGTGESGGPRMNGKDIAAGHVVVTADKKIHGIDRVEFDPASPFVFLHVSARELAVRQISDYREVKNGQTVLVAAGLGRRGAAATVSAAKDYGQSRIQSSDRIGYRMALFSGQDEIPAGGIVFTLAGNVVGLIDLEKNVFPISHLEPAIDSLLLNNRVVRRELGVNYLDLSRLILPPPAGNTVLDRGAMIVPAAEQPAILPKSAAARAGLLPGDIIVSVNNRDLDADYSLSEAFSAYSLDKEINLVVIRQNARKDVKVELADNGNAALNGRTP